MPYRFFIAYAPPFGLVRYVAILELFIINSTFQARRVIPRRWATIKEKPE
jgi:hypothetical protein